MTNVERKTEDAYNNVNFDGDTMPELCYEEGTGFFFENATPKSLKAFAVANGLDENTEQSVLEGFVDESVND